MQYVQGEMGGTKEESQFYLRTSGSGEASQSNV